MEASESLSCENNYSTLFSAVPDSSNIINNWAVEISPFRITFEYIKGIKNTLADTMSRLIDLDPQIQPETEPEGYEFGYYTFDQLPVLEVSNSKTTQDLSLEMKDKGVPSDNHWKLPIDNDTLYGLQQEDVFCKNILSQIEKGNIVEGQLYLIKDNILKRYIIDRDNTYETCGTKNSYCSNT